MPSEHIVSSYDNDLNYLNSRIKDMGDIVKSQLEKAAEAITSNNKELAKSVVKGDPKVDELERDIDTYAIRMIALRQPLASDLRAVVASLKVSSHLERIADYAANISRRTAAMENVSDKISLRPINRISAMAIAMIDDVLNSFINRDDDLATDVWKRDADLDCMYTGYVRELLTYMMEDPRNIGTCTELLFVAKNLERIGDHATNIAEMTHYLIHGAPFKEPRIKGRE